jgi:hypothetical protein
MAPALRASEVVALKVADIDNDRMVIRVEQGKCHKDRYVMHLLDLLRAWWKAAGHKLNCFPGGTRSTFSPHASSTAPATPRRRRPGSTSAFPCTRSGTASPPICSSRRSTSADPGGLWSNLGDEVGGVSSVMVEVLLCLLVARPIGLRPSGALAARRAPPPDRHRSVAGTVGPFA